MMRKKLLFILTFAALLCALCLCVFAKETNIKVADDFEYWITKNDTVGIYKYKGADQTDCVIPVQIDGRDVTVISDRFQNSSRFKTLLIPKTVVKIPDCFLGKSVFLKSITVDEENPNYSSLDGVLFNKEQTRLIAFPAAKGRMRYTVPNTVKEIAPCAFRYAKMPKVKLQSSVETIGQHAFDFVQSEQIILAEGLKEIGSGAFYDNGQSKMHCIFVPKSVTSIGSLVFGGRAFSQTDPFIVYGYSGSYVEAYCKKAGINFVAVDLPAPKKTTVQGGELCATVTYRKELNVGGFQVKYVQNGQTHVETVPVSIASNKVTKTIDGLEAGKLKVKVRVFRTCAGVNVYSPWAAQTVTVKPQAV